MENSCFIWWGKVSPHPAQASNLHIVFKTFLFKYFLYKSKGFLFEKSQFPVFPEKLDKLTTMDPHISR